MMIFFDGFIDSYFGHDFNHPAKNGRLYTTQAVRQNEPNINLAHLGARYDDSKLRSRIALQAGNSVVANTLYEPNPDLGFIQEAYAGIKVSETAWIDAGIYLGHIGMESWISKNNFTYTRSLLLDYVPYYSTGLRYVNDFNPDTHFEFHLMQGWQNISETNSAKSFGLQYKKNFQFITLTYNNYFGDEKIIPGQKNRFRTYHNFIGEMSLRDNLKIQGSADLGTQAQQNNTGTDTWHAFALSFQYKLDSKNLIAWRAEKYFDPDQSNVQTNSPNGFRVISASINYDYIPTNNINWRTEFKSYQSRDAIFPSSNKVDKLGSLIVSSIAISF